MRYPLVLVGSLIAALIGPAAAVDEADSAAIRDTISSQWDAFKSDDAERAFFYASPGIKNMFGDPETFMAMVKNAYAPVYRPHDTHFGPLSETEDRLTQSVNLVDNEGNAWTALYTMEKQADGSWRISGCRLIRSPSA